MSHWDLAEKLQNLDISHKKVKVTILRVTRCLTLPLRWRKRMWQR